MKPPVVIPADRVAGLALWRHVQKSPGCWLWTGPTDGGKYPYPRASIPGFGYRMAHRAVYELLVGPIPQGMTLDHLCRQTMCVRPDHMEPVTLSVNILRGTGPAAANARKSHCKRGHPLSGRNVWISGAARARRCRRCHVEGNRQARARARLVEQPEQLRIAL